MKFRTVARAERQNSRVVGSAAIERSVLLDLRRGAPWAVSWACGFLDLTIPLPGGAEPKMADSGTPTPAGAGDYPPPPCGPPPPGDIVRLLLRCHDRPGLIAAVSNFLAQAGANIISLDQHSTAPEDGMFLQRAIFHLPGLTAARDELEREFVRTVADRFNIDYRFTEAAKPKRVAIMASKQDHCLLDLLWRNRRGELQMSVAMVIANHPDLADHVRPFGVPFVHIPRHPRHPGRGRTAPASIAQRQRGFGGACPLHADTEPDVPRRARLPADQHPPLVPARLHRRVAVSARARTGCQAGRRHRPLRHRGARRGADHRTGRRARQPHPHGRRPDNQTVVF